MKQKKIEFTKKRFSKAENGISDLPYTSKQLIHAVVVAGGKLMRGNKRTLATQADFNLRINALISAVDLKSSTLKATQEFLDCGGTAKSLKSFYVGNCLCAHSASVDLAISHLLDFEQLPSSCVIAKKKTKLRLDFLGQTAPGRWFAFESKARTSTSPPSGETMKEWKRQARVVKSVNGQKIERAIVSAALLSKDSEWTLLWHDPRPDREAAKLMFDDEVYYEAYYRPIVRFIEENSSPPGSVRGRFGYCRGSDVYLGLHNGILDSFHAHDWSRVRSFASQLDTDETTQGDEVSLFRDGVMIRLGSSWNGQASPKLRSSASRREK
jgi:hypothetical protein